MKIKIESQEFECFEGETILEVARRNNIQIPTICFLSGCSPTLACKMCMVEVGGKRVYSCNAKVKDGMEVLIATDEILKDRKEIMTTYCVNHPLECGVCDKSGECELQDFTLHTKVDLQLFGLQEADKKPHSFAQSFYDPALCIMCERCVTTCKDNIGENNLKAGKANLFTPDAYKDTMGKDPYSVWAKRQKGLIEFSGKYECKDCGECISVCPVGAMTYKDFTYTSNAWELEKVHSTCGFCAAGCNLIYNVKHLDVKGDLQKVYRVQNDYLYNPICGVGRFAHDMVSIGTRNITSAIEAFKKAEIIYLGGEATNEEAMITHYIAKALNLKVYNHEAKLYQVFQSVFLHASLLYNEKFKNVDLVHEIVDMSHFFATFEDFKTSNSFITLNTYFKYDSPLVRYRINNNLKIQKSSQVLSIGLFQDSLLESLGKNITQIKADSQNVALAGILGLVFANDLIDDFEERFPHALNPFIIHKKEKIETYRINNESNVSIQNNNSHDTNDKVKGESVTLESETTQDNIKKDMSNKESAVNNLNNYDIAQIANMLNLENLDSLKIAKPNGILMISLPVLEEFIAHEFVNNGSYGLESHYTDNNPPNITHAVASAIMENITEPIQQELFDKETKLGILANLLAFICQKLQLKLLYIPKATNTIGIANLCDLSWQDLNECVSNCNDSKPYSVGIRAKGDFVLDSNLKTILPNFALPTLAQSEGSLTSLEQRVLPLLPSIPYLDSCLESAFDLGDIARELGVFYNNLENTEYMGDFTSYLGDNTIQNYIHYKNVRLQDLKPNFERDGRDLRGYVLQFSTKEIKQLYANTLVTNLRFMLNFRDCVAINAIKLETQNQFNLTTLASEKLQSQCGIYTSVTNMQALNLKEGDFITIFTEYAKITSVIYCDNDLKDDIFLVSPLINGAEMLFRNQKNESLFSLHVNVSVLQNTDEEQHQNERQIV